MTPNVDDYVEKLAAVRAVEQKASEAVKKLFEDVRQLGREGENWRAVAFPETQPLPMVQGARQRAHPVLIWQTSENIENYIRVYQDALAAVRQAYDALTPVQQAAVQGFQPKQE